MREGEGEEINNGEGRGKVRGRAMLCLPRWITRAGVCAEDFHGTDPAQPRPGRGAMAALQGGSRSRPFWGSTTVPETGHSSCRIFLNTGYFCQTRNLSKAMEKTCQMNRKGG